jgi:PST family polysaccharide transporter
MGTDFYPRLTGVAKNNELCNRIVNEQAQVSLLLAGPGVVATLAFAPLVLSIFYSTEFNAAVETLRWMCFGMALRVVTWPMGFIILAKGEQAYYFWSELAWTVVHLSLAWVCIKNFGIEGAGIAFFGSYIFHGALIYAITSRMSGFRWSFHNRVSAIVFLILIAGTYCGLQALPEEVASVLGALMTLLAAVYSMAVLTSLASPSRIPKAVRDLIGRFATRG